MKRFVLISMVSMFGVLFSFFSKRDSLLEVANADAIATQAACGFTISCTFQDGGWVNDGGGSSGGCSGPGSASDGPGACGPGACDGGADGCAGGSCGSAGSDGACE